MEKEIFTVSDSHIKLLKASGVNWNDCEFGAPTIDPKRPYGDSLVLQSIAETIGLELFEDADEERHLSKEQAELCEKLHQEMETVLQILLSNCHIEPGTYECEAYGNQWRRKTKDVKKLDRQHIMVEVFNAYLDDPQTVKKNVMEYVNMVIELGAPNPDPGKIDQKYVDVVEESLALKNRETKEVFRITIRGIYSQRRSADPNYDFMDQRELVEAVTNVRLQSDVAGAGSLVGALADRTNEKNLEVYERIIKGLINRGYGRVEAEEIIEEYCTPEK